MRFLVSSFPLFPSNAAIRSDAQFPRSHRYCPISYRFCSWYHRITSYTSTNPYNVLKAARIADLTRQVNQLQHVKQTLVREQHENTKLIGEYETSLGSIAEEIRNFAYAKHLEKARLSREYNKLLQEEKDTHLATRLEKDDWHAKFMRSVEMVRIAYKLRCEEEEQPVRIIAGLQNEVRAYRNALGMEPERFEEETGFEVLRELKNGPGEP